MANRVLLVGSHSPPNSEVAAALRAEGYSVDSLVVDSLLEVQHAEACELVPRIQALLQRWQAEDEAFPAHYRFGEVVIDFGEGAVTRHDAPVYLSVKELRLLRYLIGRRQRTVSRRELLAEVWGYRAANTRTLDVHIAALRQKLEDDPHTPQYILTVRGFGYRFEDPAFVLS